MNLASVQLLLSKAFGFLDGKQKLFFKLLITFVGRQVQTIKTCVTPRQPFIFSCPRNQKLKPE